MKGNSEPQYEVLWPLAKKAKGAQSTAEAIGDLSGKTVAELWDFIFRGEVIYPAIRERLRAGYPGVKFVDYTQFGNIHGPKQREIVAGLAAKLRELKVDAVISGIGA
ncbi:MAG: hypothetical protein ACM3SS_19295 [Rhodospirillaceae bacterium]